MSAFSAFRSYSKYPETRPFRWRAFWVQGAYDVGRYAFLTVTFPVTAAIFVAAVVTWPFWKIHEFCTDSRAFSWVGFAIDPLYEWFKAEHSRLHPIWERASGNSPVIITRKRDVVELESEE
jgi:hypothetical protein